MKIIEVKIVKLDTAKWSAEIVKDYVAEDRQLQIFLNGKLYATMSCSPDDLKELAIGHLLSDGLIKALEEIEEITIEETGVCSINVRTRPGVSRGSSRVIAATYSKPKNHTLKRLCKVRSNIMVKAETILKCVETLSKIAETYRKTGGVHVAAIYKGDGSLICFAEDVGRYNAVDKAIGKCALAKANFNECLLAVSGRLSSDMVSKAATVRIPIIASISAALSSGVKVAKAANITLIGFVRGNRMNIYNAAERIVS